MKFSTTVPSNIFSVPFFFSSSSGTPIIRMLVTLMLSQRSLRVSSVLFILFSLFCSAACGTFLDQGSNPCPLHWQAGSQPLHHQGSPLTFYKVLVFLSNRKTVYVSEVGYFLKWGLSRLCRPAGPQRDGHLFHALCHCLALSRA